MSDRVLYQFHLSPFSTKVRRILEFKGLAYTTFEVNPFARGVVRRISGQKRVPVLVESDGGGPTRVVADSTAIALALDARYPEKPVYPRDREGRARVLMLEEWSDSHFARDLIAFKVGTSDNARRMVAFSRRYYPPRWYYELLYPLGPALLRVLTRRLRDRRSVSRIREEYEADLDLLDDLASGGAHLGSQEPTAFDFAVWGLLWTMEGMEGRELLDRRGHLRAWYDRLSPGSGAP